MKKRRNLGCGRRSGMLLERLCEARGKQPSLGLKEWARGVGSTRARLFGQWLRPLFYRSAFYTVEEAAWQEVEFLPAAGRT